MGSKIKICGIRREEDCEYINEALPDYAGFIFWPKSFRYIDLDRACELRTLIDRRIRTVAVFVDEDIEEVARVASSGAVNVIQLHGHEDESYIDRLRAMIPEDMPVWKAYKVRSDEDLKAACASKADMVLLDNGYGTGQCFDHGLLRDIGREYILAGGLNSDNIEEVVNMYSPYMVDLSSGVETDKYKDRDKIIKAVMAARK